MIALYLHIDQNQQIKGVCSQCNFSTTSHKNITTKAQKIDDCKEAGKRKIFHSPSLHIKTLTLYKISDQNPLMEQSAYKFIAKVVLQDLLQVFMN